MSLDTHPMVTNSPRLWSSFRGGAGCQGLNVGWFIGPWWLMITALGLCCREAANSQRAKGLLRCKQPGGLVQNRRNSTAGVVQKEKKLQSWVCAKREETPELGWCKKRKNSRAGVVQKEKKLHSWGGAKREETPQLGWCKKRRKSQSWVCAKY